MGGRKKNECSFCQRPFRVKSRRKSDLREDSVEEAEVPGTFSNFAPVWIHLGVEVTAKVMGEGRRIVPPMCVQCFEIVEEVERIHEEIGRFQEMLEVAVERLRRIVEARTTEDMFVVEDVIEMKDEEEVWMRSDNEGGSSDGEGDADGGGVQRKKQKLSVEDESVDSWRTGDHLAVTKTEEETVCEDSEVEDEVDEVKSEEDEWVASDKSGDSDGEDSSYSAPNCNDDCSISSGSDDEVEVPGSDDEVEVPMKAKKRKRKIDPLAPKPYVSGRIGRRTKNLTDRPESSSLQKCEFCLEKVALSSLPEHLASHVGGSHEYVIRCLNPKCKVVFLTVGRMVRHVDQSRICRRVTESLKTSPLTSPLFNCEICGFHPPNRSFMPNVFRTHLKTHEVELPKNISCPVDNCKHTFALKQSVQHHLVTHQGQGATSERSKLPCGICGRSFDDREKWLWHQASKHRKSEISCEECKISVGNGMKMYEHFFKEHGVGMQFMCEQCPSIFYTNSGLQSHMRAFHAKAVRTAKNKCDRCDAAFKSKMSLTSHQIKKHGDKGFECIECDVQLPSEAFLKFHVARAHRGEKLVKAPKPKKTYTCEKCGKTFPWPKFLAAHLAKAHPKSPDLRPFACEVEGCGKAFYDKLSLGNHKKSSHAEVKPVCEVCGMTFANKKTLKLHKLVHTGERPHACDICGQRFRHRVTLTTHLKSHAKKGDKFKPAWEMKERAVPRKTKTDINLQAARKKEGD